MSKTALIILGILCLLLLVLLFLAAVPRLKLELARMPAWAYLLAILVLAGVLVLVGVRLFASRGTDALTSKEVDGTEQGDQETSASPDAEKSAVLKGAIGDSGTVVIRIHGSEIRLGSAKLSGAEELEEALHSLAEELSGRSVRLEDDYALSGTWKEVKGILDENGIRYTEKILQ